jgi:3-(3-hydroxy-phenyl)propionate hydroxylase
VCVVGLGPTGLLLTHLLARRGLSVLVLEQEPQFYGMARAVYTDDEVLRVLQNAGVADEVHADMITDVPVRWVRKDRSVLAQFGNLARPHAWPISNFLYQPRFENALERRLAGLPGVTVRRGRSVVGFAQCSVTRHGALWT